MGLYYDAEAIHRHAERQEKVKVKESDFATEFESLLHDAGQGFRWAQHNLGLCYIAGEGLDYSQYRLGRCYGNGMG